MEMDVAVAEMAEGARRRTRESGLDLGRGRLHEARHVGDGHGNVVSQRRAVGALRFGEGIADPPESVGLRLVGCDHCILDQALFQSLAKKRLQHQRGIAVGGCPRSPR